MPDEKEKVVHAPYNFVPFPPKKPLERYPSPEDLPRHDVLDPELKTGTIHVTLTADTPVFISDGEAEGAEFFRDPQGRFVIPGSTLRGMVRENMTILGFGMTRPNVNFGDRRMFFREMAAARNSTGKQLKDYYTSLLDIECKKGPKGNDYAIAKRVQAGYLYREGSSYFIRPALGNGSYRRVRQTDESVTALRERWEYENPKKSWYGRSIPISYLPAESREGKTACEITEGYSRERGRENGTLLITGKWVTVRHDKEDWSKIERIPNRSYVFPLPDPEAAPLEISQEDAISYAADWEDRVNPLKAYFDPDFWKLPREGEEKPVFFLNYNGHIFFGMSLFLRVGYKHSLGEGLPERNRELLAENPCFLDYPYSILGFAEQEVSYRSRVAFEDCPLEGPARRKERFPAILGEPKPSFYPGYVEKGDHYGQDDFQLRGSKQYWLKEPERPVVEKERVASSLRPLAAGSRFRGVIHYRNLAKDELGLLLWCLRLDEGCYQSIGMGKPYGYGRMKVTIDKLEEWQPEKLYSFDGLCGGPEPTCTEDRVEQYIRAYEDYACPILYVKKKGGEKRATLRTVSSIRDFLFLRRTIMENEKVSYMTLPEYKNPTGILPTVQEFAEEAARNSKAEAAAAPKSDDDLRAALLARFGRKH